MDQLNLVMRNSKFLKVEVSAHTWMYKVETVLGQVERLATVGLSSYRMIKKVENWKEDDDFHQALKCHIVYLMVKDCLKFSTDGKRTLEFRYVTDKRPNPYTLFLVNLLKEAGWELPVALLEAEYESINN